MNSAISQLIELNESDSKHHDCSLLLGESSAGITIHVNEEDDQFSYEKLSFHCIKNKYTHHANHWYGICFSPRAKDYRFFLVMDYPWVYSQDLESLISDFSKKKGRSIDVRNQKINLKTVNNRQSNRVGRNDLCLCGSGKKYKKCCLQ